jgi:thioester reductase-like protein
MSPNIPPLPTHSFVLGPAVINTHTERWKQSLILKLTGKSISTEDFAETANHIIVTILHTAGEEILGLASIEPYHPRKMNGEYHASSDPQETDSQKRIQALEDQLKKVTELNEPQSILDHIAIQLKREKRKLDETRTQKQNHVFLPATGAAQPQAQDPKTHSRSMWDYLKRYIDRPRPVHPPQGS